MSSFISSLFTNLGLLNREPPRHSQLQQPDPPPSGQTKPSSHTHVDHISGHKYLDSLESESIAGDAGTLPSPPFFTALPKDMDGLTSDLEATRRMPQNVSITSESGDVFRNDLLEDERNNTLTSEGHIQPDDGELAELPNHLADNDSIPMQETTNGLQTNQGQPFNLADMAHMSLPADDGMTCLRNKIHAIRDLDLGNNEKARMVHDLMTENYKSSRPIPLTSPTLRSSNLDPPLSPLSPAGKLPDPTPMSPTLPVSDFQDEEVFSVSEEDLQPTYVPKIESESPDSPLVETGDEDPDTEELDGAQLGCQHYMRNVKLQCFTCKKWVPCRFCHDEVEDHHLIRRETKNMLCMLCGHPQPADQNCRQCGEQSAQYYCDICKLWDNDGKKSIYHCNDCGICRIGQGLGKDFFHCKTCCVCLPISIEDTHRCIERSTQCDCPICGDYMFTSPETVVVMRCGHSIHNKCLGEYSKSSFRCPICSKTITNMESTFRNLDRTIESQPMPSEFKDTNGLIYCNDCGAKSVVKYHWLGLKCDLCESYNTAQIRLLQGDVSAVLEEEGFNDPPARARAASLSTGEDVTASLAALHLSANPAPQARLSVPSAGGSDQQHVSYNMTRGRAISPVVSNYFGLPKERESEKPSSLPFFGSMSRTDNDTDFGALNFLSKKLRDHYGFLAGDTAVEGVLEADEEDEEEEEEEEEDDDGVDAESSTSSAPGEQEENEEDDDEIDIFGHR
ncbi:hypothetical protein N7540_000328 [Penicillium herquei]|nr:hypothetical protein N7540_000328 [Penicillium herquei]